MRSTIRSRSRRWLPLVAVVATGFPGVALAEEVSETPDQPIAEASRDIRADEVADAEPVSDADAADAERARRPVVTGVEEITVTARKREERLQDTPISISAFSTEGLRDLEVRSVQDVQNVVPNLQFDTAIGSASSSRIYIRGVGNGDLSSRDDPGVGVYVDGVYLPRSQGTLLTVSDLERVEVLRGPQGTLFGRNTIGGAINVITKKPAFEFGGVAEVRGGTNGLFETRAAVDIPLIPEMAAMRVSVATATNNGRTHNRFTGSRVGDNKVLAGRVQLLLTPTDTSEFILAFDHSRENRSSNPGKCKVISNEQGLLQGGLFRFIGPEIQSGCEDDDARANDEITQDGQLEDRLRTYGANFTGTFDLSDGISLKSITSWRRNKIGSSGDTDGTVFDLVQNDRSFGLDKSKQDAISQEFNLNGLSFDGRMQWTVGLYGFVEKNQFNNTTRTLAIADGGTPFQQRDLARDPLLGTLQGIVNAIAPGVGRAIPLPANSTPTFNGVGDCITPANPATGTCLRLFNSVPRGGFLKTNATSYAAYGEFSYDITEALSLTAGLRYTHERKRVAEQIRAFNQEGPFGAGRINEPAAGSVPGGVQFTSNYELSQRFSKFTPRLTLKYAFTDDINTYATISRGFKSGGFAADADGLPPNEFDPEVLTSYELGFKSSFLDNRLVANIAGYINYYEDIQLTTVSGRDDGTVFATTLNAGEARIFGTELELSARPTPQLSLSTSLGITKARYTKFEGGNSNARLPGTPALTMSYTAAYLLPLGDFGDLRSTVTWSHQGKKGSDVSDPDITRINKRGLLSGRMTLEMADGVTEIALFGTNLLNREYFVNAIDLTGSLGITSRNYAPGRSMGVELRRRF